jgi:hypothetical protein
MGLSPSLNVGNEDGGADDDSDADDDVIID